jgi:hemoglobin
LPRRSAALAAPPDPRQIGIADACYVDPMSATLGELASRRARAIEDITTRTGIDEAMIERLVRAFYARVQADPLLAPIFAARIVDWEPHLARMCAFWSSVALMSGRYHGQPFQAHMSLPVDETHFTRWLALFENTAHELCPPTAAAHFIERARRIAQSLQLGIAATRGALPGAQTTPLV